MELLPFYRALKIALLLKLMIISYYFYSNINFISNKGSYSIFIHFINLSKVIFIILREISTF